MKPHRIRMTHNLLLNYGLYRKMEIYVSYRLKYIIFIYLHIYTYKVFVVFIYIFFRYKKYIKKIVMVRYVTKL